MEIGANQHHHFDIVSAVCRQPANQQVAITNAIFLLADNSLVRHDFVFWANILTYLYTSPGQWTKVDDSLDVASFFPLDFAMTMWVNNDTLVVVDECPPPLNTPC